MILIDNKNLKDLGLRALAYHIDEPTYSFSSDLLQIPKRPGFLKVNEKIETRQISVSFRYLAKNNAEIDAKMEELNALFFDHFGDRKKVRIELLDWRGKFAWGYLAEIVEVSRELTWSDCRLDLICYDPFKYSNEKTVVSSQWGSSEVNWGSTDVTFADPYTFAYQSTSTGAPQIIVVDNKGLVVYPKIIITGSADSLIISANGQSIQVPAFSGTLEIERFIAFLNGKEFFVDSRKFYLKPGENQVRITGTNASVTVKFEFNQVYK